MEQRKIIVYILGLILCFAPFMSPALALLAGMVLSFVGIREERISRHVSHVLQYSIVLMGFGMSLASVWAAGKNGLAETAISVGIVMTAGILLGKLLKLDTHISLLIASGTAICGGSAIAAISPIIGSKSNQSSMALMVVFVLNAVALFVFPLIGHSLHLSQHVFGNWAAIAIHDTSSVVGAGAAYGNEALQVATTVKLVRALWIIPLSIVVAIFSKNESKKKFHFPWFILFFVAAIIIANALPQFEGMFIHLNQLGRKGVVVALFLMGSTFKLEDIKKSGFKSFGMGIVLWAIIAVGSLVLLNR